MCAHKATRQHRNSNRNIILRLCKNEVAFQCPSTFAASGDYAMMERGLFLCLFHFLSAIVPVVVVIYFFSSFFFNS